MIEFETLHADTVTARLSAILFILRSDDDDYSVALGSNGGITYEVDKENYDKIRAALTQKA